MSSISGVSSSSASNAWANAITQRNQMQAKMFSKVDTDSSGSVDQTELSTMLSDISAKTGTTLDSEKLFNAMDSNSDGSLSSDELASGMQSAMPPPSTMDFAQNRSSNSSTDGSDDLFSKVDTNSDGSVDESEMTAFTDKMKTETGRDSPISFATLDADSDGKLTQTEFDAGRPSGGPQGAGGPPPAGGPGGATATSATDSKTYDKLDTNEDGTVSELERLAGALNELVSTSESSDASDSTKDKILQLAKQVYEQIASGMSSKSSSTLDATA